MKTISFLTKVELKKHLQQIGIQVECEHIRKSEIKKVLANRQPSSNIRYENKLDPKIIKLIPKTDALRNYIMDKNKTYGGYTAYDGKDPIGFCSLHSTIIEVGDLYGGGSDRAVIVEIIVSPEFRGAGIGEELLKRTSDLAYDEMGFDILLGYVNHSTSFKKLSKKYNIKDLDNVSWNKIYS